MVPASSLIGGGECNGFVGHLWLFDVIVVKLDVESLPETTEIGRLALDMEFGEEERKNEGFLGCNRPLLFIDGRGRVLPSSVTEDLVE